LTSSNVTIDDCCNHILWLNKFRLRSTFLFGGCS
jgi:hypothetical protein